MPFPVSMEVRLLLLMAIFTLLVSGESKGTMGVVVIHQHPPSKMQEKHRKQLPSPPWRHSFSALFASKRKVPNTSDPLHNRWSALGMETTSDCRMKYGQNDGVDSNWEAWPRGLLVCLPSFSFFLGTTFMGKCVLLCFLFQIIFVRFN